MFVAILAAAAAKHLLYIVFDDLRPELGAYGVATIGVEVIDSVVPVFDVLAQLDEPRVVAPPRKALCGLSSEVGKR